jgi:hypothetical protein
MNRADRERERRDGGRSETESHAAHVYQPAWANVDVRAQVSCAGSVTGAWQAKRSQT